MAIGIRIRGLVQGVGFRPTLWRVAHQLKITGDICNDGDGVWVRLNQASQSQAEELCYQLEQQLPQLARIDEIEYNPISPFTANSFTIAPSQATIPLTGIVPDSATCCDCVNELFDRTNRRFHYPFINCTNCGPRLSIIKAIPYDRDNTSMSAFPLCSQCHQEYLNPADRRYHAQPNACEDCGPYLWLDTPINTTNVIEQVNQCLQQGKIIGIKGIGGYHLACDALNQTAVQTLRKRKKRYGKAFALMAKDIEQIKKYCTITEQEARLLLSPAAPIVLLQRKINAATLPYEIATEYQTLGFMLPYSPLHHLLLKTWENPLVMTSGNISDEPQCINNRDALDRLGSIADHVVQHNRDIINRVDDSVVRVMGNKPRFYRRARGFAPAPILLHPSFKQKTPVLALGGELKNTICLVEQRRATISQHLGDLEEAHTYDEFEHTVQLYKKLFDFQPQLIAIDKHPNYRSSNFGRQLAKDINARVVEVQHHHAHIASVMAEQQLPLDSPAVVGIALDGLGYGDDGTLWGGEFLLANYFRCERLGSITPFLMLGGTQAIKEPWRNLYSLLKQNSLWNGFSETFRHLKIIEFMHNKPLDIFDQMMQKRLNTPATSSAGRLFDAVAAALLLHHESVDNEGEAAIALEHLATHSKSRNRYHFEIEKKHGQQRINTRTFWQQLFDDLNKQVEYQQIAADFHHSFASAICQVADTICKKQGLETVVLSGGVFQNKLLLEQCLQELEGRDLICLHHEKLPTNDGGLSLGQATIALGIEYNNQRRN